VPLKIRISRPRKSRRVNSALVEKAAVSVLSAFKKRDAEVDITFVSDKKISSLNKKYLHRNGPTDVISFLFGETPIPQDRSIIGDIYISLDAAGRNAVRFKNSFRKEILLYTIHGVLHLLGFGDKSAKEKKKIRMLEKRFLKCLKSAKTL